MILQLNPPISVETPKGPGIAHALIDYGPEADLVWVVFLTDSGQCWSYRNQDIRASRNITIGRFSPEKP